MSSPIHLSFRYTERDYVRAYRAHYATRLRLPLDILVIVICAVAGIYHLRSPSLHWVGLMGLCVAVTFALLLIAVFTVIPMLLFRREPKFRDDYSLIFSPEGIHFRTVHIDSQLQWKIYSRALSDTHSYLLYYGGRQFTVIPKRVFQSAEQQHAFEELMTQQMLQIVRRR